MRLARRLQTHAPTVVPFGANAVSVTLEDAHDDVIVARRWRGGVGLATDPVRGEPAALARVPRAVDVRVVVDTAVPCCVRTHLRNDVSIAVICESIDEVPVLPQAADGEDAERDAPHEERQHQRSVDAREDERPRYRRCAYRQLLDLLATKLCEPRPGGFEGPRIHVVTIDEIELWLNPGTRVSGMWGSRAAKQPFRAG